MKSSQFFLVICLALLGFISCRIQKQQRSTGKMGEGSTPASTQQASSEQRVIELKPAVQNGKYGYIDGTGRFVIKPQFEEAGPFSEGLAWVRIGKRYGYIDTNGNVVIKPLFEKEHPSDDPPTGSFSEGLAAVQVKADLYGYIDKSGQFVIKPQFQDAQPFSEGLAAVQIGGVDQYRYGYIDKTGKFVIKPQFEEAGPFSRGRAQVKIGGKTIFIDKTGKDISS